MPALERSQHIRTESAERRRYAVVDRLERRNRRRPSDVEYHDRPRDVRHIHRYEHVYRDHHNRICHRIVWPRYRFAVYYNFGPHFVFRYVYPYYHRKYVFVSIGGTTTPTITTTTMTLLHLSPASQQVISGPLTTIHSQTFAKSSLSKPLKNLTMRPW